MTERPYTDDDLRAEAAVCLMALSTSPTTADIRRWITGAYVESRRAVDRSGPTWDDLLDTGALGDVAGKIAALISDAADTSEWAVNLGADGLEPDRHTIQLGVDSGDGDRPRVRLHFAFHPDMADVDRDHLVMQLSKVVLRNL